MAQKVRSSHRTKRRENAAERASVERTPQQQLEVLDRRFGVGEGAAKERAKLARQINLKKGKK